MSIRSKKWLAEYHTIKNKKIYFKKAEKENAPKFREYIRELIRDEETKQLNDEKI